MLPEKIRARLRRIFNARTLGVLRKAVAHERTLRILRRAFFVLAIFQAVYLVAGNIALRTDAVRDLLGKNQGFGIEYRSAWTLVPTVIHTRDLYVRAQHSKVQWGVSLERCRFRIHVWPLVLKKLRISGIRGDAAELRLRPRLTPGDLASPRTQLLPPVRGYASPPMQDNNLPPPPSPDAEVWHIELADAEIAFQDLWLAEYYYVGPTHASWRQVSGIVLDPDQNRVRLGRDVALGEVQLESYGGAVRIGSANLFEELRARFTGVVHRFEVEAVEGSSFMHFLSGEVVVDATLPDLQTANYYLADSQTKLLGGRGALHADLRMKRGTQQPGSNLRLTFADVIATVGPLRIVLPSSVEAATWTVTLVEGRALGRLGSRINAVRIDAPALEVEPMIATSLRLTLQTRMLDHSVPPTDMDIKVAFSEIAVPDLRLINVLLPKGADVRVTAGSATAQASVDAGANRTDGTARISMLTQNFALRVGDTTTIRGHVIARATANQLDLRKQVADLDASVEIQDATASPGRPTPWWGKVALSPGRLGLAPAFSWTASVRADVLDVRPLYDRVAHGLEIPTWTRKLGSVQNLGLTGGLVADASHLSLHDVEARAGNYHVYAVAERTDERSKASILVTLGSLSLGIRVDGDDKHLVIFNPPRWFQGQLADARL